MKINYQRIFWAEEFIPKKVQEEYVLRWSKLKKLSLEEFLIAISKDDDKKWWIDSDHMFKSYDHYIFGYINDKYPKLEKSPRSVLFELIEEANKMIHFKE